MSENQGTTITTAAATVATTSTATSVTATTTATAAIAPVDSRIVEFVSRRRGIGKTLPVGWKPLLPPTDAVRRKIHEQIMTRRKEEERDRAERAARAEERKNEEEKHAWHREQIAECEKKIQNLNARKVELDEAKSKLFAELKEVVAKSKDRTQNHPALYTHLIHPQARNKEKGLDTVPVGSSSSIGRFSVGGLQNAGAGAGASEYSDLQMHQLLQNPRS